MTMHQVEDIAMQLSPEERELLAQKLLSSLGPVSEYELTPEWQEEVQRRLDDFESGREPGIPAEQVFKELREEFGWK